MNNQTPNNTPTPGNLLTVLKSLFKSKEFRKALKEILTSFKGLSNTFDINK